MLERCCKESINMEVNHSYGITLLYTMGRHSIEHLEKGAEKQSCMLRPGGISVMRISGFTD